MFTQGSVPQSRYEEMAEYELLQFKFNPGSQLSRRSQNKHDLLDVRSGPTVTLRT